MTGDSMHAMPGKRQSKRASCRKPHSNSPDGVTVIQGIDARVGMIIEMELSQGTKMPRTTLDRKGNPKKSTVRPEHAKKPFK